MSAAPILTIFRNGEKIDEQSISGESILGRAEGCVVRLEDRAISRQHAILRPIESGLQIEKKSEFGPISVNGAEVTRALLKENDVVVMGPFIVRVSYPKPPEGEPQKTTENLAGVSPLVEAAKDLPREMQTEVSQAPLGDGSSLQLAGGAPGETNAEALPSNDLGISLISPESPEGDGSKLNGHDSLNQSQSLAIGGDADTNVTDMVPQSDLIVRICVGPSSAEPAEYEMTANEAVIGRTRECQIVIRDKKSSRRHAKITRNGKQFSLKDLDTVNGTYLNGERIQQAELTGDDLIQIGDTEIKFQIFNPNFEKPGNGAGAPVDTNAMQSAINMVSSENGGLSAEGPAEVIMDASLLPMESGQPATPAPAGGQVEASADALNLGVSAPLDSAIPGIPGSTQVPGQKRTIRDWFRKQPKKRQIVLAVIFMGLMSLIMFDMPEEKKAQKNKGKTPVEGQVGSSTFEKLSADKKTFVETQHALALDLLKARDFDKSLLEVRKIFTLIPDYLDSRTIERVAEEGKRRLQVEADERKKKEDTERVKARVSQLVEDGQALMNEKNYEKAQVVMNDILGLDPENANVAKWKAEIEQEQSRKQIEIANQSRIKAASADAWNVFSKAKKLQKQGRYYPAIAEYQKAIEVSSSNRKVVAAARAAIQECREEVNRKVAPLLEEAKREEDDHHIAVAYKLYHQASVIDPNNASANRGMNRVREELHLQAKQIYSEGVIAESYSDFDVAQKKFRECLEVAPEDDIYNDRAKSRLRRYQPYGRIQEATP